MNAKLVWARKPSQAQYRNLYLELVRVYTTSEVENELEVAKNEYLQAAVGISTTKHLLMIPKLLDWYMFDFAKDMESFLHWVCLQLHGEVGKEAMKCLERQTSETLSDHVRVSPYEFHFRIEKCWRKPGI
ncbi:hypothetical protein HanXRQr2_Chr16g0744651 [Helianthus annuus]|uniref:Uncharacterized protein n=1 Tax=Helianthus annuus TaxID=4232 RepID=A0A251RXJ6_HELAN|nr:hypothetical protein HanXRQr2_Chr16g0744651 [Helianthus annuus]KAJ0820930.1 hypothetical protein HanPSC8_Chr16g0713941 [Helianthus annuus]